MEFIYRNGVAIAVTFFGWKSIWFIIELNKKKKKKKKNYVESCIRVVIDWIVES